MPTLFKRSNGIYYVVSTDATGKRRWVSTTEHLKSRALEKIQSLQNAEIPPSQVASRIMLKQFMEEFLSFAASVYSAGNVEIYQKSLKAFLRQTGNIELSSINERHIDLFKASRLKEIAPVTVNIELRTLRAAFYVAMRWKMVNTNPLKGVRLCRVDDRVPAHFTLEEFRRLMKSVKEEWLRDLILVAGLTGMRRGEILNLKWTDVDLTRKTIAIQSKDGFRSKCGKRRVIPMNEHVHSLLQAVFLKRSADYVFLLRGEKIRERYATRFFKRYVRKLGLNDELHFHSLRHSFATWLVQDGASIYEVQKLLGHSNIKTTEIYSHLATDQLHQTVQRIAVELN